MEFVASYLLCVENHLEPSKANIAKMLSAASVQADAAALDDFMSKVGGKTTEELFSAGSAMMTLQRAAAPSSSAPAASAAKAEEKEDEETDSDNDAEMSFF